MFSCGRFLYSSNNRNFLLGNHHKTTTNAIRWALFVKGKKLQGCFYAFYNFYLCEKCTVNKTSMYSPNPYIFSISSTNLAIFFSNWKSVQALNFNVNKRYRYEILKIFKNYSRPNAIMNYRLYSDICCSLIFKNVMFSKF